jgi:hypothetical protein
MDTAIVGALNKAERAQYEEKLWKEETLNPSKFKKKIFDLERDEKVDASILSAPWFLEVKEAANAKREQRRKQKKKSKKQKQKRAAEEKSRQGCSPDVLPSSKQEAAKEPGVKLDNSQGMVFGDFFLYLGSSRYVIGPERKSKRNLVNINGRKHAMFGFPLSFVNLAPQEPQPPPWRRRRLSFID